MSVDLNALAAQSAAQGQQMLNQDNTNAAQYRSLGDSYQAQADAANKNVQDYSKAMQGAYNADTGTGNAGSTYDYGLNSQLGKLGYDQNQMTAARGNLNQATGALSAYSDFANTAASKYGMNAGGFAAANSGALAGLNNNIASNQNVVNGLSDLYKTAQTGANQFTGLQQQGEVNQLAAYKQTFDNATDQRDSAYKQMNFWADLASKQGGLNADQQNAYAGAAASYAAATASQAAARDSIADAQIKEQQYAHQQSLWNATPAANPTQTANKSAASISAPVHNQYFNVNSTSAGNLLGSLGKDALNGLAGFGNWAFNGIGQPIKMIDNG